YQGALTRLARLGVNAVGIPLDRDGLRTDAVAAALDDLKHRGIRAKYIYTIPTVQNPTGTILSEQRRHELLRLSEDHGVPIFEDDCYADLIWDGRRPPALHAMSKSGGVIHIGSFSKSIAPALRVGYIVARWDILSRILALKTDAGSGALEQMVLAEVCTSHFTEHVPKLTRGLPAKLETLMEALAEQFGTSAEFDDPKGGIFLWVKLPDAVDTQKLAQAALAAGFAINPGRDWSTQAAYGKSRLRLCFANPSTQAIREGVAVLADVCRRELRTWRAARARRYLSVHSRESGNPPLRVPGEQSETRDPESRSVALGPRLRGDERRGEPLLFHLQRQPYRLAGGGRALDGDGRFQIDARLLGRGMDRVRASREMIEPGAGLVAERAPEIADRPIARGIAAEKRHVDGMIGHVGVGDAFLRKQQMIEVIVVDDHGAVAAEQLHAVGLPERGIARGQRVAHAEIDHRAVGEGQDCPGYVVRAITGILENAVLPARHHLDRPVALHEPAHQVDVIGEHVKHRRRVGIALENRK